MINLIVTLLIIALIAGVLGFGGVEFAALDIARTVFFVVLLLFVISVVFGATGGWRRPIV
ncbi:MAG TPA: DUF1328 family protein [Pseudolabrys sp.]|nr:DUF1328 family protein [Pseudolabrys sp.]